MVKQIILLILVVVWLVITVGVSVRIGKLQVALNLYKVRLKERDEEISYCMSEIKKLVLDNKKGRDDTY